MLDFERIVIPSKALWRDLLFLFWFSRRLFSRTLRPPSRKAYPQKKTRLWTPGSGAHGRKGTARPASLQVSTGRVVCRPTSM
jgi:hypothetical protein